MSVLNYSKWDNIIVSDDEDEQHPNIHKDLMTRLRHEKRVSEETRLQKDREAVDKNLTNLKQLQNKTKDVKTRVDIQCEIDKLNKLDKQVKERERKIPKSVDTLCSTASNKTLISENKKEPKTVIYNELEYDERVNTYTVFRAKYKHLCEDFADIEDYDESMKFLIKNKDLISDHTNCYLASYSINNCKVY